jgi:DNA-directed RNA polymerase subunit M/transcription elongation factor TFIIS
MQFPYLINVKNCFELSPPRRMFGLIRLVHAVKDIRKDIDVPMILEELIYKKSLTLVDRYSNTLESDAEFNYNNIIYILCSHLDTNSHVFHKQIYDRIVSGELSMKEVCELNYQDFNHENRSKIMRMVELRLNCSSDSALKRESILYKCSKCKSRNCEVRSTQTRALDESSCVQVKCKDCGTVKNISY